MTAAAVCMMRTAVLMRCGTGHLRLVDVARRPMRMMNTTSQNGMHHEGQQRQDVDQRCQHAMPL